MHVIQAIRTFSIVFVVTAGFLFLAQTSEARRPHQEGNVPGVNAQSVQMSINGLHVNPERAKLVMRLLCNGLEVCNEEIWPQYFQNRGLLTSLTVIYTCQDRDGFHEFEIDNEGSDNQGTFVRLNCYRANTATGLQGGELSPTGIVSDFALSIAEHLAGGALDQLLFPSGIDIQALAEAMKDVIKQELDQKFLDEHQSELNAELDNLTDWDENIRIPMDDPSWYSTVYETYQNLIVNNYMADVVRPTVSALVNDTQQEDIRGEAFPSYIAAASAYAGGLELQQELENLVPPEIRGGGDAPSRAYVSELVDALAQDRSIPSIINFTLSTKADIIYDDLRSTQPQCYRITDTEWAFKDCNGTVHRAASNAAEWNYDACYVNADVSYSICAEQAYASAMSPDVMGWIDDTVQGWRDALVESIPLLPVNQLPCDICTMQQSFITVDKFLLGWKDTKGNAINAPDPTVLVEARCNGLNQCDAYFSNEELPGYNPGDNNSSAKRHISALAVIHHCATDTPGTTRVYSAISGVDFDSNGGWVRLNCADPPSCTNPSTCMQ